MKIHVYLWFSKFSYLYVNTEKSVFQITVEIPTERNERPIAFNVKPQGYYRKAIGLSFLSVGISTVIWKADFSVI